VSYLRQGTIAELPGKNANAITLYSFEMNAVVKSLVCSSFVFVIQFLSLRSAMTFSLLDSSAKMRMLHACTTAKRANKIFQQRKEFRGKFAVTKNRKQCLLIEKRSTVKRITLLCAPYRVLI